MTISKICRLPVLLLFCLLSWQMRAQSSFDATNWNFGKISEADGVVSHTFVFRNTTGEPLRITGALPSCNCIMAQLPDGPVGPGKIADITVFFAPSGAAGPTHRTIEILGSKGVSLGTLSTDADVIPSDRSIGERYPIVLAPSLYANMNTIPFGYMAPGQKASKVIYLANSSDGWMYIETSQKGSGLMTVQCPEVIGPGKEVAVMLTYSMPAGQNFVTRRDTLTVKVEGSEAAGNITTSAICLTKGSAGPSAPRMRVYPNEGELRSRLLGHTQRGAVGIYNDGAGDLVINGVEAPAGVGFSITPGARVAPGKSLKAELEVPEGTALPVTIRLFVNDPQRPYKDIIFNAL